MSHKHIRRQQVHNSGRMHCMKEEMEALHRNKTWEFVPIPQRHIVGSKWVYKIKRDSKGVISRYKARLVAQGFSQQPGTDFDEIYAPVIRYDSLRLLIAISAHFRWRLQRQLDIKAAFLYGTLKEEIYMQLPQGHRQEGMCAKLNRCIYGLKQSPREWYARLTKQLIPLGFTISTFNPCVLVNKDIPIFITIYVDDLTLFGPPSKKLEDIITSFKTEFKVTDLGTVNWLLGIQIEFLESGIALSQAAYIDKIFKRFGMFDCSKVSIPIDPHHTLHKTTEDSKTIDKNLYQQIIGSIMYTVIGTRPDLAYTITLSSRYSSNPSPEHLGAVKRVLRYLKCTRNQKLHYSYGPQI